METLLDLARDTTLAERLAALHSADCFPGAVAAVQAIETHMSWVFLTEAHAWKLKKPVRQGALDFRTLAARRFYCLEELRLNRALAPLVYLDVLPLTREADGRLRVGGQGTPVDWLVKMRRLAPQLSLDALVERRAVTPAQVHAIATRLAAFHGGQPPAGLHGDAYRELLLRQVDRSERELSLPQWALPAGRLQRLFEAQRAFVRRNEAVFDDRVAARRVVEGHGDLRLEHVWLGEPLAIIDALEFSRELRLLDGADEIAFLAMELEAAGAAPLARELLTAYARASGDAAPPALLHFHQSRRACERARLAIGHLHEERYRASPRWRRRALRYLVLAERHLARALLDETRMAAWAAEHHRRRR